MTDYSKLLTEVRTIEPREATTLLATKKRIDRSVSSKHVTRLSHDMTRGLWVVNGDSIKITEDGELIDGQHRLRACEKAKKPFTTLVTSGLPRSEKVRMTIDTGRTRNIGDALRLRGNSYRSEVAGAAAQMARYLGGDMAATHGTSVQIGLRIVDKFNGTTEDVPGFLESAAKVTHFRRKNPIRFSSSFATWLHYVGGEIERRTHNTDVKADEFWSGVLTGLGLNESNDSRVHLRNRYLKDAKGTEYMRASVQRAVTVKAWNAWYLGNPVSTLGWKPDSEPFPQLVGDEVVFEDWVKWGRRSI